MIQRFLQTVIRLFLISLIYLNQLGFAFAKDDPSCNAVAELDNRDYKKSLDEILNLAEVRKLAKQNPQVKIGFGGEAFGDGQQAFMGQCYWSITVYLDDTGNESRHRWKSFLVSNKVQKVYELDDGSNSYFRIK